MKQKRSIIAGVFETNEVLFLVLNLTFSDKFKNMDVNPEDNFFPPPSTRHPTRRFVFQARKRKRKRGRDQFWWLKKKRGTCSVRYNPPNAIQTPDTSEDESAPNKSRPKQSKRQKGTVDLDLQGDNPNDPHCKTYTPPRNPNIKRITPSIFKTKRESTIDRIKKSKRTKQGKKKTISEIREIKEKWLSSRFSTNLEKSRWVANDRTKKSITDIPMQLIKNILTCLNDDDLQLARLTCHFFNVAFFKQYQGKNIEKGKFKTLMNYANLGYSFDSITNVSLKYSFHSFEQRLITDKTFPSLKTLQLQYVKLEGLYEHKGLQELILSSCEYDWGNKTVLKQRGFAFPNLELLRIENGSPITEKNNIPKLEKLKVLEIFDTYIDQPLTKNKFKHLRKLVLIGKNVVQKIPNIRISRLWDLTIDHTEFYPIKRENQFKFLKKLKLVITGEADPNDIAILKRLNHRYFPYLEVLILEFGTEWTNCDFRFLERHNHLRRLELHSRGMAIAERISSANFPNLKSLVLNCDSVDIEKMPMHEKLEYIMVPKETDISQINLINPKCPKLVHYGNSELLNPNGNKQITILSGEDVANKELQPLTTSNAEKSTGSREETSFFNLRESKDGRYLRGAGAFRTYDRFKNQVFIVTNDGNVKNQNGNIIERRWGQPLQLQDLEILVVGDNGDLAIIDVDGFARGSDGAKYLDGNFDPIRLEKGKPCRLIVESSTEAYIQKIDEEI